MKFLVLYSQGPNPPAEAVSELAAGSQDWVSRLMSEGQIETTYLFPDGGGFAVFNADSPEALQELLHSNPSSAFVRHESRPLLDFTAGLSRLQEHFGGTLQTAARIVSQAAGGGQARPPR
jgi:muconolactone delta-isomerase